MSEDQEYYYRTTLTHSQQIEEFGWCMCEGEGHKSEGCANA